ncbi:MULTISPECIES: pyruvate kinase [Deefgea]|uniref:Pyruvate kinase n=1 Tax=Deefgea chitinilytica TaxID=570276 RepID=A0ABS2CFP8_9NEIS|nr:MULTISPECIES: pyruvate kinase [Deefgea]MBM5572986.1 pyruvate kinase [Deefgea chitinilytica]MBM9890222.1 pyruvate kinase [Deefgea sp. CFH1-16]
MNRSTKIVATLGPSSNDVATLERLLQAGVNMVRLNFSHGTAQDHLDRAALVREIAKKMNRPIAIMVDLQGPKIRVGKFEKNKIELKNGAKFVLDAECTLGNQNTVGLDYKELPNDVEPGVILLLDDGKVKLQVDRVEGQKVFTTVLVGGTLSNNKGINRQGGGLTAPALTGKDMEDIKVAAKLHADYVAVSFPKSSADMYMARTLLKAAGSKALLIAKIERTEAIANLDDILTATDGIMVARGDLAVEVGDAAVPALQKRMIKAARRLNKLTITATQMMESMISSPVPTRAEVSDVANAVLDGTDAVMLSAETASGQYPVETVESMARVCVEAEKSQDYAVCNAALLEGEYSRIDQTISMAALFASNHLNVKVIAALTQSGSSALWMSRVISGVPIYALTPEAETYNRLALFRDVEPVMLSHDNTDRESLLVRAEVEMLKRGIVQPGDMIAFTFGDVVGMGGGTNCLKIVKAGETKVR